MYMGGALYAPSAALEAGMYATAGSGQRMRSRSGLL